MLKNLVYSLITKIAVALVNFAILLVSSRYLGVSSRGEISIFILNMTIIQIINEVYTGYSIVHFIPKYNFKKLVGIGLIYSLIFCSLSNAIIVILKKQLVDYEWMGYVISFLVILNTFNCVLILGKENLKTYNLLSFIQPFFLLLGLFIFIFVLKIYTVAAFVYPLFISFSLAFLGSSFLVLKYFFSSVLVSEFKIKPIIISGIVYQAAGLMFIFSNRYSYYILPNTADVGLYSSASSLMESVLIVVNGISPVVLSRIANQSKPSDNVAMTLSLGKASLLLSCLLVAILFFIPSAFFVTVLGAGFSEIKSVMLNYSPAVIMASFFIALSNYFIASGNQKIPMLCYGLGFFSSIILAPILIRKYGVNGAALNADISYLIMSIAMCSSFLIANKLNFKRIISVREDVVNLKRLFQPSR
jgi:O-antigen/teichoic acid export membrane protein